MSNNHFSLRQASWDRDHQALLEIRKRVFIDEQHVPKELEWDGLDQDAIHILVLDSQNHPIGTGRRLPNGQIGRMAVLYGWRNRGVGSAILTRLMVSPSQAEGYPLFLNAQVTAVKFYQRHGFHIVGPQFMDAGIIHYRMEIEQ
ncbi:MAG: GNAT family N-acetyltransferase [Sedimenticola sp.]